MYHYIYTLFFIVFHDHFHPNALFHLHPQSLPCSHHTVVCVCEFFPFLLNPVPHHQQYPLWGAVSLLSIKSLTHFEFILVYGVRRWSIFIFLHISLQFSQHHWLNKVSLAYSMFLPPLSNVDYNGVGLFLESLFCSTGVCVCFYASTMLFWLVWLYSIVWY